MGELYPNLQKPGKMGPWELPNRVIMAPMGSLNADSNGYVTDNLIAFYQDMAKGGMGLIVVECTYTDEDLSKGEENGLGFTRNDQIVGMRRLATAIHDKGVKCVLQLCHIGHQISLAGVKESLGPSEMVEMMGGVMPFPIRGATRQEIKQIIQDFADCAYRAKMAGFDGVQIHGAIGHLINMFCTPFYNRRTDEYGGTPENRIRFMKEIIEAVHEKCGKSFPVIARICGCDFDPDGITMEEGIIHAKILEKTGIAALHVVAGSNRNVRTINIQYDKRGDFLEVSANLKKAGIKVPIIIDGGLSTPDIAEKVLVDGIADYIGLGRPMLADPDWGVKLKEGRPEDIRPCIRCCMGCVGTIEQFSNAIGLRCSVNPTCNLTRIRQVVPAEKKKKVCIIGGGPGGMEAALVATKRGHKVTIYEKRKLGGMVNEASFDPAIKGDLRILMNYYETQVKKNKIKVVFEEATEEKVLAGKFDVVIDATGSIPVKVTEQSSKNVRVHSLYDFASNPEMELGEKILIVGGCFPNAEMAYSLLLKGKDVTLSTTRKSQMEIGDDNSSPMFQRLSMLNGMAGLKVKANMRFRGVDEYGAVLTDLDTKETIVVPCNDVLVCHGFRGTRILYDSLKDKVSEIYRVGDCQMKSRCVSHTTIGNAIEDGWVIANRI